MLSRSNLRRIAALVGVMAALIAGSARAADTANGSKNFAAPTSVPNYFANEAGPMQGPASETRRGTLYMNQTYGTPTAAAAAAVAVPRVRQHIAMAEPRGRVIRGRVSYARGGRAVYERRGRSVVAERRAEARGHPVHRAVYHAEGRSRGHVERAAVRTHSFAHHPTRVSSVRHARG